MKRKQATVKLLLGGLFLFFLSRFVRYSSILKKDIAFLTVQQSSSFFLVQATESTSSPTTNPTGLPSAFPTSFPSSYPSSFPTTTPTGLPSTQPSAFPTSFPSSYPTVQPSALPSSAPLCRRWHRPSRKDKAACSRWCRRACARTRHGCCLPRQCPTSTTSS